MTKIIISFTLTQDIADKLRKAASSQNLSASQLAQSLLESGLTPKSKNKELIKEQINNLLDQL
jgi:hypothetical protein